MKTWHSIDTSATTKLWRESSRLGILLSKTHYPRGSTVPPHRHEEYVVNVVLGGGAEVEVEGRRFRPEPAELLLINPGETHSIEMGRSGWSYLAFYPNRRQLGQLLGVGSEYRLPRFRRTLRAASCVSRRLARAHATSGRRPIIDDVATFHEALTDLFERELEDQGEMAGAADTTIGCPGIHRARQLIARKYNESLPATHLASVAGLSRAHFVRRFRAIVGRPPHAYQTGLRLVRAKQLLRLSGYDISDIALFLGFSSQSHFTTTFRRSVGMTPKQFRRQHNLERPLAVC